MKNQIAETDIHPPEVLDPDPKPSKPPLPIPWISPDPIPDLPIVHVPRRRLQ